MKILIHSNAPWVPSGYGSQVMLMLPRLKALGHEVAVSSFYGLSGSPIRWQDYTIFPAGRAEYGTDVLPQHAMVYGADLIITLMDTWKLGPCAAELAAMPVRVACLVPGDCAPLGRPDRAALEKLGASVAGVSQFSTAALKAAGFGATYIPHGIDTAVFTPRTDERVAEIRAQMNTAGKFAIGICSANKDAIRKGFPEQLEAYRQFHLKHPDSMLFVHTEARNAHGHNLAQMVYDFGIADSAVFTDEYAQIAGLLGPDAMADWFAGLDVLSICSWAEAFGIPSVEAQAVGTPVICTDGSAMSELAGPGWKVAGQPFYNPVHGSWWVRPDIKGIVKAYEKAYRERGTAAASTRRAAAVRHAQAYDIDRVFAEHWKPWLDQLAGTPEVVEFEGLKWAIGSTAQNGDTLALGHELDMTKLVLAMLPEGGVFLDVGAHVGHYAVRAAAKASKVIAVEANPSTAERLLDNVEVNNLANVTILQMAAWDCGTYLHLHSPLGHEHDGGTQVHEEGDGVEVQAARLDQVLIDEPRVDLVKIDVEGADLHVLRGMAELLDRCQPVLFIEDHSVYGMYDRADLDTLIKELGYDHEDVPGGGWVVARPA